jgi:hypothetical protein
MRCRVNTFNCHSDNDTGNLVTEPLSSNGWQLWFRYNLAFRLYATIYTYIVSWGGVRLSLLGMLATNWPIVPALDDRWWWMWSSRWNDNWQGKPKYSKKPVPVPLFPSQIPSDLTWAQTLTATLGNRRLTAWAMAWPCMSLGLWVHYNVPHFFFCNSEFKICACRLSFF